MSPCTWPGSSCAELLLGVHTWKILENCVVKGFPPKSDGHQVNTETVVLGDSSGSLRVLEVLGTEGLSETTALPERGGG